MMKEKILLHKFSRIQTGNLAENSFGRKETVTGRKMIIERNLTATTVSFDLRSSLPNQEKSSVKSKVKSKVLIKNLMTIEPGISLANIAESIGMSLAGVEKSVRNMKAAGEIERKDGKKGQFSHHLRGYPHILQPDCCSICFCIRNN